MEQAETVSKNLNDKWSSESINKINTSRWDRQKHSICGRCGNSDRHETFPATPKCLGKSQKPGRGQGNQDYHSRSNRHNGKHEDWKKTQTSHSRCTWWQERSQQVWLVNTHKKNKTHQISRSMQRLYCSSTNESDDSSTNSDGECYMQHLKTHHTSQNKISKEKTCTMKINGNDTQVEPDTGSDTNIKDEHQFKKLQEKAQNVVLKRSNIK